MQNAKKNVPVSFDFSGGRTQNSSMSFNTECKTRCETLKVRYFANW